MASNYNERLDDKINELVHLLTYHLTQEKRYQLLNLNSFTEETFDMWVESLKQKDFSFSECQDVTCLWNIEKAPH